MSASAHPLPTPEVVQELLGLLLGEDVIVRPRSWPVACDDSTVSASYVCDEGHVLRVLLCDLVFAASAGAALTMLSPAIVRDALEQQELPRNISANLKEVLSICVNLFADSAHTHLVLQTVVAPKNGETHPEHIGAPFATIHFDVVFPRYGVGAISLLALPA